MSVAAARCHKAQDFHTKVRMAAEKIVQLKITNYETFGALSFVNGRPSNYCIQLLPARVNNMYNIAANGKAYLESLSRN